MDTYESESVSMEKALNKLDALVSEAMSIEEDPSARERLAADAEVAAAAKQALQILRAVQVDSSCFNTVLTSYPQAVLLIMERELCTKNALTHACESQHHCGMQAAESSKILPPGQDTMQG